MLTRSLVLSSVVSLMIHTGALITYTNITSDKLGDNIDDIIEITFIAKESSVSDSSKESNSTLVKNKSEHSRKIIDSKVDETQDVNEIAKIVKDIEMEKKIDDRKNVEVSEVIDNDISKEVVEQIDESLDKVAINENISNFNDNKSVSRDTVISQRDEGYYIPKPEYPNLARKRSYEGVSRFRIVLDDELEIKDIILLSSSGYNILDRAARKSIENGKYNISKKELEIAIRFSLDDL